MSVMDSRRAGTLLALPLYARCCCRPVAAAFKSVHDCLPAAAPGWTFSMSDFDALQDYLVHIREDIGGLMPLPRCYERLCTGS